MSLSIHEAINLLHEVSLLLLQTIFIVIQLAHKKKRIVVIIANLYFQPQNLKVCTQLILVYTGKSKKTLSQIFESLQVSKDLLRSSPCLLKGHFL